MHYCSRSPERTAFVGRGGRAAFASRVYFHFDDGAPAQRLDLPAVLAQVEADSHLYVCGPRGFIDYVTATAKAEGWPAAQIHVEYFAGEVVDTAGDGSFELKLAKSGRVFTVPVDNTVVAVLAENGIAIPTRCEQGVCGTCLTRVLEGEIDHRDSFLLDEEKSTNKVFTPCCSRARSRMLVLDL